MKACCALPLLAFALAALVNPACADDYQYTDEDVQREGLKIMEESRQDGGHWVHALEQADLAHMENHIGPNGLAFAGFFVGKHVYKEHNGNPRESTRMQAKDDLFLEYKRLAKDQRWIAKLGMGHKTWTFAYSHDAKLAKEVGCGGDNVGAYWDHMCIVVYKTSRTGKTTFMHPSTRLTPEAHEHAHKQEYGGYRHKPEDILPHLQKIIKAQVKDAGHGEL